MTRVQLSDAGWEFFEPCLPIGEYGPYPERLRQQFEGVIRRFKTGGQWREMPQESDAWSTVHNPFRQWRDAGAFEALLEGLVTKAAKRGGVHLSVVSVDSTTARAHPRRRRHAPGRGCPHRLGEGRRRGGSPDQQAQGPARHRHRYDKAPDSYLDGLHLRASLIWIKDLILAAP
ncbi:transposase [Streptomyces sp. NBC_01320]|uniref:transposase n=1 Tax=Streptomyces sp. NBC_01320 TaxID=2903824 RepID=UPI003FA369C5